MTFDDVLSRDNTGRINAFAETKGVSLLHSPVSRVVGLQARLLDPETREATPQSILLQMERGDAWAFAQYVLAVAKEQDWGYAMEGEPSDRPGHPRGMN